MFFILSKIIGFFLDPAVWLILIIAYSIWTKNLIRKKRALLGVFIFLLVFTNPLLFNFSMKAWETNIVSMDELPDSYPVGIVLGGYAYLDRIPEERLHLTSSANRLTEAIQLYKAGKIEKILLSGGMTPFSDLLRESEIAKGKLINIGIPSEDIWADNRSRSTYENGIYSQEILNNKGVGKNKKVLLITSAFHQRRATKVFEKLGYQVDGYGTDILQKQTFAYPTYWIAPQIDTMRDWQKVIREIMGMLAYKLKGYL